MRTKLFLHFSLLCALTSLALSFKPSVDENGTISHTICDGHLAELSCPTGKVISIVIGNYGRFSNQVCIEDADNFVPSNNNCQNHKTKSILERKCNGRSSCDFLVSKDMFIEDPCPATSKYLEVKYNCVVTATTTTTTTTSTTPSTTTSDSSIVVESSKEEVVDEIGREIDDNKEEKMIRFCAAVDVRGVKWPRTRAGLSTIVSCPEGSTGKQSWMCADDGRWTHEPNTTACESNWVASRSGELNEVIGGFDATGVPHLLRSLAADTRRPMVSGDVPKVLHLLERFVELIVEEPWTRSVQSLSNKFIIEVMNTVLKTTSVWRGWDMAKRREFAARFLLVAENAMVSSSDRMSAVDSNVIVQPLITCEVSHKIRMSAQPTDYVLFPSSALWGDQTVDNVNIPREAIAKIANDEAQVFFSSFENVGNQMEPRDVVIAPKNANEEPVVKKRKIVSRVVGATLIHNGKRQHVEKLSQPIRITFYHKQGSLRRFESPTCVWWNYHQLDWSPLGCHLASHNGSVTVCECDHLTHFAVLMDVRGNEIDEMNEQMLTMLTFVGCIISIACLLMTFLCYTIFTKGGGDRVFIHQNLCLSLAIAEITFLAGIAKTDDSWKCGLIAITLLYLFLTALVWMLLEGYHIYRMLVEVFPSESRKLVYAAFGYLVPAIVTSAAYMYDPTGFGTSKHCWLRTDNNLMIFFVGPASFILVINTLVLAKTLCVVYKHTNGGYLPCRHDVDSGRSIRSWVKGSMALVCLLGVTWSLGLLWIDDGKSVVMAYLFTVFNSLQGLFIFLFHVVFSEKMRQDIAQWFTSNMCFGSSASSTSQKRSSKSHHDASNMMSPGMGSSTGTDFLYPSSEKYLTSLDTTNRLAFNGRMPHPNAIPHQHMYEPQQGTYDYATIAYGDMIQGHHRMAAPPAYQRMAYATSPSEAARYGVHQQVYVANHPAWQSQHRPPPEFSPPPPPPSQMMTSQKYQTTGRRPPSSKMSDDSAYSDGGSSSMLTTEVTPQGQTVLRIDLNKPNMYCQEL